MDRAELERRGWVVVDTNDGFPRFSRPPFRYVTRIVAAEAETYRDAAVLAAKREVYEECAKLADEIGAPDTAWNIRARAAALEKKP